MNPGYSLATRLGPNYKDRHHGKKCFHCSVLCPGHTPPTHTHARIHTHTLKDDPTASGLPASAVPKDPEHCGFRPGLGFGEGG